MLEIGVCAETSVGFLQRQNIDFHARSSIVLTISSPSSALWDVRQATFQFVQDMFLPSQKRSGPGRYLFPIIENSSKLSDAGRLEEGINSESKNGLFSLSP